MKSKLVIHNHIDFGGQKVPLRYCYAARKAFQDETGIVPTLEVIVEDPALFCLFTWHALRAGYRYEGKDNPFERADMPDLIELAQPVAQSQEARPDQLKKTTITPMVSLLNQTLI
ncbi:MAG: hypothetical protein HC831_14490 [Chloroflexia bacterium]|nr:hypothetical protein [Chloroflexia bacterium]